jgi:mRNA-degrading endonuclease RelE of RelBE toxin-antitoxin system
MELLISSVVEQVQLKLDRRISNQYKFSMSDYRILYHNSSNKLLINEIKNNF